MIIWDKTENVHNIRIGGLNRVKLTKYLSGSDYVNKNVTIAQAETVARTFLNTAFSKTEFHCYLHIFTMPKKTQETVPFDYVLWCGPIGMEPSAPSGLQWWESPA